MKRKTVFLFSGQGAQYYQMGRELYEQNPVFRSSMDRLDRLAREILGMSVVRSLYGEHGKAEPFDDIRLTHPAIFMVEISLARTVIELGIEPDCTLGASLGTAAALVAAGCLPEEDALALVIRQALTIERHCPRGAMLAVLAEPEVYAQSPFLQARSVIAGQNFARHFVLSIPEDNLAAVQAYLARAGVLFSVVPVRYPFHTPWLDPIRDQLIDPRGAAAIRLGATPVICCGRGGVLDEIPDDYLWRVARGEIYFMDAIHGLEQSGPFNYVDLGPSGTLATFVKYLLPQHSASRSLPAMTPFGRDQASLAAMAAQLLGAEPAAMAGM